MALDKKFNPSVPYFVLFLLIIRNNSTPSAFTSNAKRKQVSLYVYLTKVGDSFKKNNLFSGNLAVH